MQSARRHCTIALGFCMVSLDGNIGVFYDNRHSLNSWCRLRKWAYQTSLPERSDAVYPIGMFHDFEREEFEIRPQRVTCFMMSLDFLRRSILKLSLPTLCLQFVASADQNLVQLIICFEYYLPCVRSLVALETWKTSACSRFRS